LYSKHLAAAWRRDYGDREQEVRVNMNLNTGEVSAYITKEIVELDGKCLIRKLVLK
jgi:hypothetical protein